MFGLGGAEIFVIVAVALLVFGPSKLPQIARAVKAGYAEFRKITAQVNKTVTELRQDIDLNLDMGLEDKPKGAPASLRANTGGQARPPSGDTAASPPKLRLPSGERVGLRPPEPAPVREVENPLPVAEADDYLAPVSVLAGDEAADDYLAEAAP